MCNSNRPNVKRFVHLSSLVIICLVGVRAKAQPAAPRTYTLFTEGEEVTFEEAPELGYVTRLSHMKDSFMSVVGSPLIDVLHARPLRGRDRSNIWTVENVASASVNRKTINRLKMNSRIGYVAPMFTVNEEPVGVIPEIVVRVKPGVEQAEVQALCESVNLTVIKSMDFTTQEYLLEVPGPDAKAVFESVDKLSLRTEVEWAWPNGLIKPRLASRGTEGRYSLNVPMAVIPPEPDANTPGVFPNDEYFPMQWHLHNTGQSNGTPGADIRAPQAWEITTGDPNIIIAVPDTGVDLYHPDLVDNLILGYDFYDHDDDPNPDMDRGYGEAHGTSCAGLAAAKGNNSIGVVGVTWDCRIMPVRLEPDNDSATDADIASAFRWMADQGADVITNSWGSGYTVPITHSAIIDITRLNGPGREGRGCVIIDASGNSGRADRVRLIGRYPEVISVGASDHNDILLSYSNHGTGLDLVAPSAGGTDEEWWAREGKGWLWTTDVSGLLGYNEIYSAYGVDPNIYDYMVGFSGTSGAAPIASGVAALILSIEPTLTTEEVRFYLTRSAKDLGDPGYDTMYGWGRVDARAALDMVLAKRADLDDDSRVDLDDLVILIESWGTEDPFADIAPATKRDGIVDDQDLELMMQYWDVEIPEMDVSPNR